MTVHTGYSSRLTTCQRHIIPTYIDTSVTGVYSVYMPTTNVRDLDPRIWRDLRVVALQRGQKVGVLVNVILSEWLDDWYGQPASQAKPDAAQ